MLGCERQFRWADAHSLGRVDRLWRNRPGGTFVFLTCSPFRAIRCMIMGHRIDNRLVLPHNEKQDTMGLVVSGRNSTSNARSMATIQGTLRADRRTKDLVKRLK